MLSVTAPGRLLPGTTRAPSTTTRRSLNIARMPCGARVAEPFNRKVYAAHWWLIKNMHLCLLDSCGGGARCGAARWRSLLNVPSALPTGG